MIASGRERIMERIEYGERLNRQFGVDRFAEDDEWWPKSMRGHGNGRPPRRTEKETDDAKTV